MKLVRENLNEDKRKVDKKQKNYFLKNLKIIGQIFFYVETFCYISFIKLKIWDFK